MTLEAPSGAIVRNREKFFVELYEKAFPAVASFVSKMGGTFQDAKDIFQDALIILYEKAVAEQATVITSESAYVLGISKHLWIRKFNHDKEKVTLDALEAEITIPEDFYMDTDSNALIRLLELTGKRCLELLTAFYYEKLSMGDIAKKFGYATIRSATVQKYKCLEKVRNQIKGKSISYESFVK